jgi:hypothetical protein
LPEAEGSNPSVAVNSAPAASLRPTDLWYNPRVTIQRIALQLTPLILVLAGLFPPVQSNAQGERLVLAFYYAWYDESTWQKPLPDQPSQPYTSTDPAAMERHVAWAQQAGIDAFVQSWYGPQVENNQTEPNFAALLEIAAGRGFQAAVDFEVGSPFLHSQEDVVAALQYLLTTHATHPGYLKVNGRPVIFFWRQDLYSVETWHTIRQQVDPQRNAIWIAEGVNLDMLAPFDGNHLYSVAWDPDPASVLTRWGARVRDWSAQHGAFRYWVATTMPGYDDHVTGRANAFTRPRAAGAYYRSCWEGAVESGADWVVVTSFNEWMEGSYIEPSVNYGETYLNLTRELAAGYRSSALPAAPSPPSEQLQPPSPTPTAEMATQTPASTPSPSPSPSPTLTPTPTPSPSATPTATWTATAAPTSTPLPSATPSPTALPSSTPSPTVQPSVLADSARLAQDYPGLLAGGIGVCLLLVALFRAGGRRER